MCLAGACAHVLDGALKQIGEQLPLFFRESRHHSGFIVIDGAVDPVVALFAFGQNEDPLDPPVIRVCLQTDELLLLQPGENTGYCRMAQMEFVFNVPGAKRLPDVGKIPQYAALGGGKIHLFQLRGHGLIGTPVQGAGQMAKVEIHRYTPPKLKCSMLHISLAQAGEICNGFGK